MDYKECECVYVHYTVNKTQERGVRMTRRMKMYHLVGRVVGLQLLVVGVLHEDGMVPYDGCDGGVIVHHRLSRLLSVHLQKSLG